MFYLPKTSWGTKIKKLTSALQKNNRFPVWLNKWFFRIDMFLHWSHQSVCSSLTVVKGQMIPYEVRIIFSESSSTTVSNRAVVVTRFLNALVAFINSSWILQGTKKQTRQSRKQLLPLIQKPNPPTFTDIKTLLPVVILKKQTNKTSK